MSILYLLFLCAEGNALQMSVVCGSSNAYVPRLCKGDCTINLMRPLDRMGNAHIIVRLCKSPKPKS